MDEFEVFVGRAIRRARMRKGLKQTDLASAVGVTPETVSNFERGRTAPSLTTLGKLAHVLGIPPHALLSDQDARPSEAHLDRWQLQLDDLVRMMTERQRQLLVRLARAILDDAKTTSD